MTTMEDFRRVADVNIFAVVNVTKQFLPLIRASKGRIVNVASVLGFVAAATESAYCIAKFGVEAFSSCLRQEVAQFGGAVIYCS